jgi:hypothetical protein
VDAKSPRPNPWTYVQAIYLVLRRDNRVRAIVCMCAVLFQPMKRRLFYVIVLIGVIIGGILGYVVDNIPIRVILPSLVVSVIILVLLGLFLKGRGILT